MKFDMTGGLIARYLVVIYSEHVEDYIYFHYYRMAKEKFNTLVAMEREKGTAISLYELHGDRRLHFFKY